jgi:hypothetical protein
VFGPTKEPPIGYHFVVRACGILISVESELRDSNTKKQVDLRLSPIHSRLRTMSNPKWP